MIPVDLPPPVLVITLPLPDKRLGSNARSGSSRRSKSGLVKAYREAAATAWLVAKRRAGCDVLARATMLGVFYRPKGGGLVRDEDGALTMMKAAIDGAQDAGVIPGDSSKYLRHLSPELLIDAARPRLEVGLYRGLLVYEGPGRPGLWRAEP